MKKQEKGGAVKVTNLSDGGKAIDILLKRFDDLGIFPDDLRLRAVVGSCKTLSPGFQCMYDFGKIPVEMAFSPREPRRGVVSTNHELRKVLEYVAYPEDLYRSVKTTAAGIDREMMMELVEHRRAFRTLRDINASEKRQALIVSKRKERQRRRLRGFAVNLYNSFWRKTLPHLDSQALKLTRAVGGSVHLYNALVENPALFRMVRDSKVLGVLLASMDPSYISALHITEKDSLETVLLKTLNDAVEPTLTSLSPVFLEWARIAHFTPLYMPWRGSYIRNLIGEVAELSLSSPESIKMLKSSLDFRIFHGLIVTGHSELVEPFLKDLPTSSETVIRLISSYRENSHRKDLSFCRKIVELLKDVELTFALYPEAEKKAFSFPALCEIATKYQKGCLYSELPPKVEAALLCRTEFDVPLFVEAEDSRYMMRWLDDSVRVVVELHEVDHTPRGLPYYPECAHLYLIEDKETERTVVMELDENYRIRQIYGYIPKGGRKNIEAIIKREVKGSALDEKSKRMLLREMSTPAPKTQRKIKEKGSSSPGLPLVW